MMIGPEHGVKRLHTTRMAWVDPSPEGPAGAVRLRRWCACFGCLYWNGFIVGLAGRAEPLVVLPGLATVIASFGCCLAGRAMSRCKGHCIVHLLWYMLRWLLAVLGSSVLVSGWTAAAAVSSSGVGAVDQARDRARKNGLQTKVW